MAAIVPGALGIETTTVILVNPSTGALESAVSGVDGDVITPSSIGTQSVLAKLLVFDGALWNRPRSDYDSADARLAVGPALMAVTRVQQWNGAAYDRMRVANVFKTATVTATGSTAVWTPATGKKFRLMGYSMAITGNAIQATAGNLEAVLLDAAAAVGIGSSIFVPAVSLNVLGLVSLNPIALGNGYLSAAANNALNVNLSTALTGGEIRINVWGTEE